MRSSALRLSALLNAAQIFEQGGSVWDSAASGFLARARETTAARGAGTFLSGGGSTWTMRAMVVARAGCLEWLLAAQHFVEDQAERKDIGASVVGLLEQDFGAM